MIDFEVTIEDPKDGSEIHIIVPTLAECVELCDLLAKYGCHSFFLADFKPLKHD